VTKISFASRAAMRLHVIPEVIVWELENAGKECEKSTVDRFCEIVAKCLDFVHEW
jgi:hypothetical protein